MATTSQLDIKVDGIARALAERQLSVPIYQRSYAWQDDNVRELLLDIREALKDKANEYFLGSIVLTRREDGKMEVVDGQQRLATVSMVIAAIRDYFFGEKDEKRANQIDAKYLQQVDLKTQESTPQLSLNTDDDSFYRGRVLSFPGSEFRAKKANRESQRRLDRAASLIAVFVADVVKTTKNSVDELIDWLDYLEKKAKIIIVEVPDDSHAWLIFETLNDRGLDLSIADLLKNYLFGMAKDRLPEVQANWAQMVGAIESVGDESTLLMHLRQLWASYNGLTRERELFSAVKKRIDSKQRVVEFSLALAENARSYSALLNPLSEFWAPYGDTARAHVDDLASLRFQQPRPLILSIMGNLDVNGVRRVLRSVVSCSIRFTILGQLGSSALESLYAEAAQMIRNDKLKGADEICAYLTKKGPLDQEFEQAFAIARVSSALHARYYLRTLEMVASGKADPEFIPNANREHVNLEHVLPQTWTAEKWPQFNEEQASLLVNRIGNLALLRLKKNSEIGNVEFPKKREMFKESEFQLTRQISENQDWKPVNIEERQAYLAKLALKAWAL